MTRFNLFVLCCTLAAAGQEPPDHLYTCRADPDLVSSGYAWSGVGSIRLGDCLRMQGFFLSGLVCIRNEPEFNQALLPNHNWRGVARAGYAWPRFAQDRHGLQVRGGFEHESAHPTMGIEKQAAECDQMIYDGSYRRYLLNSLFACAEKLWQRQDQQALFGVEYQWYLQSKNTPELASAATSMGHGLSAGLELRHKAGKGEFFFSLFDRFIATGKDRVSGKVHFASDSTPVCKMTTWPVLRTTNLVKGKTGYGFFLSRLSRLVCVYASLARGTPFGFVDSRDIRTTWMLGIEFL